MPGPPYGPYPAMRATPALVLAHKCAIRTTFGPRAVCLHTSFVCRLQATSNPNQAAAAVCSRTSVLVASNLTWCCTPFKGWVPDSPCACTQVCAPRFFATPERRLWGPKSVSPTLGRPPIAAPDRLPCACTQPSKVGSQPSKAQRALQPQGRSQL